MNTAKRPHALFWLLPTLVGLLFGAAPAHAAICGLDTTPAATLLLPYFEVDTDDPQGLTTLMSIHNADIDDTAVLVTVWSDLGVQVMVFNSYLGPKDVLTLNLRDLLAGNIPATFLPPEAEYPGCPDSLPAIGSEYPPLVPYLRDALTGRGVMLPGEDDPLAFGVNYGDDIARGFITVDVVNTCTGDTPEDATFWLEGGMGTGSNRNILWGDYFYVNTRENFAQGMSLLHLEADDSLDANEYTFYRRTSSGADNREPLARTQAVRFAAGGGFDGGTTLYYWRDVQREIAPFEPGTLPAPFPLDENTIHIYDEDDQMVSLNTSTLSPFPYVAGKVVVGGPALPVPFDFGWIEVDLNTPISGSQVPFGPFTQAYLTYDLSAQGRFSVGSGGASTASACLNAGSTSSQTTVPR